MIKYKFLKEGFDFNQAQLDNDNNLITDDIINYQLQQVVLKYNQSDKLYIAKFDKDTQTISLYGAMSDIPYLDIIYAGHKMVVQFRGSIANYLISYLKVISYINCEFPKIPIVICNKRQNYTDCQLIVSEYAAEVDFENIKNYMSANIEYKGKIFLTIHTELNIKGVERENKQDIQTCINFLGKFQAINLDNSNYWDDCIILRDKTGKAVFYVENTWIKNYKRGARIKIK